MSSPGANRAGNDEDEFGEADEEEIDIGLLRSRRSQRGSAQAEGDQKEKTTTGTEKASPTLATASPSAGNKASQKALGENDKSTALDGDVHRTIDSAQKQHRQREIGLGKKKRAGDKQRQKFVETFKKLCKKVHKRKKTPPATKSQKRCMKQWKKRQPPPSSLHGSNCWPVLLPEGRNSFHDCTKPCACAGSKVTKDPVSKDEHSYIDLSTGCAKCPPNKIPHYISQDTQRARFSKASHNRKWAFENGNTRGKIIPQVLCNRNANGISHPKIKVEILTFPQWEEFDNNFKPRPALPGTPAIDQTIVQFGGIRKGVNPSGWVSLIPNSLGSRIHWVVTCFGYKAVACRLSKGSKPQRCASTKRLILWSIQAAYQTQIGKAASKMTTRRDYKLNELPNNKITKHIKALDRIKGLCVTSGITF